MSSLRKVSLFGLAVSAQAYGLGASPFRAVRQRTSMPAMSDSDFDGVKPSTVFSECGLLERTKCRGKPRAALC